jgi:hypothetical protein
MFLYGGLDMTDVSKVVAKQAIGAGMGATVGAITKHAVTKGPMSAQVGSAIGATLATGGTVAAALGAGAGTVTAAATAATVATSAAVVAAAPFVAAAAAVGGGVWLLSKLFDD